MDAFSELRRDIVSGEWVVVATGRAKRPDDFAKAKKQILKQPAEGCPFEILQPEPLVVYSKNSEGWWVQVVNNKYPAFSQSHSAKHACPKITKNGPYEWMEGVGYHEVVVSRDHERNIAKMSDEEVELIIRSFQDRFLAIKKDSCAQYVSVFQNHGLGAGASIAHPHLQIVAVPVIPPDVGQSLEGSKNYFHQNKECVHCVVIKYELHDKSRIVYENEHFLVVTPFASKSAFEIRIFPKKHSPHFEGISIEERFALANSLRTGLAKLHKGLKNPDYNFFLHTSPVNNDSENSHYHWHIEIIPKTAVWAGFEIGTGIEISTIAPEIAAEFLRKIKI
ncbi:MAG: galactose-1-phosphate uridylyltransferase [bacterium]|nr:galactose-1-phosphate uridylyltransferase [bacterium]